MHGTSRYDLYRNVQNGPSVRPKARRTLADCFTIDLKITDFLKRSPKVFQNTGVATSKYNTHTK